MGVLRDRMIRELQLRRYAPTTQKTYLEAVVGLTKHFGSAPDRLTAAQVEDYALHLMNVRHLQWNSVNTIVSGLTFFYTRRCADRTSPWPCLAAATPALCPRSSVPPNSKPCSPPPATSNAAPS